MKTSSAVIRLIRENHKVAEKLRLTSTCLTSALAILLAGTAFGQNAIQINGMDVTTGADEAGDAPAPYIIFSNLGSKDNRYNTIDYDAKPIVGRQVSQITEGMECDSFCAQGGCAGKRARGRSGIHLRDPHGDVVCL